MRVVRGIHVLLFVMLLAVACAPTVDQAPAATPDPVARGRDLYTRTCSPCHGPDATGIPGLGKNLVGSEMLEQNSDATIVSFIKAGRPIDDPQNTTGLEMPPYGGNTLLSDADLFAIVAYLRSLGR